MANLRTQPTGGCTRNLPGSSERLVAVTGDTYRYRRYLSSIGLRWIPEQQVWLGRLTDGKRWFVEERLGLRARPREPVTFHVDNSHQRPPKPRRKKPVHKPECFTAAEYYVGSPLLRGPDTLQPERSINQRHCWWGCELCETCLECISNLDENGVEPVPGSELDDGAEQAERENAVLPTSDQ